MAYVNTWGWAEAVKGLLELVEQYEQTVKRLTDKANGVNQKERIGSAI
jgi:hypothetical protein